jgi:hypothetical protein
MLETAIEVDEEGMTVPYPPLFDDIGNNRGFIDVRGRPDIALKIAEGSQSSAMKALLVAMAQPGSQFFTVGCHLGTEFLSEEEHPHTAGGYVQIMHASYADRSPEDYARFAQAVAEILEKRSASYKWRVQFILTPVAFKLDDFSDMTGSLWIWFHAFANT